MKISHIKALSDEDIRIEVKADNKHWPVKVTIRKDGNDIGISAANLFVFEETFDNRVRRFAMSEIASVLKGEV